MALRASFTKKVFTFGFNARTSRGLMPDKTSWFIKVYKDDDPHVVGIGECGPLPGLSVDDRPDFEAVLEAVLCTINKIQSVDNKLVDRVKEIVPPGFPSLVFGLETALLDLLQGGQRVIYQNGFVQGKRIPINGLIWMGDFDFMIEQIDRKITQGFRCIKLKVGGLDFDRECEVLRYIRDRYTHEEVTIRLDANGAFTPDNVLSRLEQLAMFAIHSIEQPLKPGLDAMETLCQTSPIPVALDEELIGIEHQADKIELLERIRPSYIILKPSLHGGFAGCSEWIVVAEKYRIGWWITSALESNIGLNAICQFTSNYAVSIPQGLGTGGIYENNIPSPLVVEAGEIFYASENSWNVNL
ncbi:MAG: o-succinylbenzoate synthase [Cyclobacteriaceae bacterium]|nr:o-succinylbenzoate synthase [Cyclobacteriaceae bacterium]